MSVDFRHPTLKEHNLRPPPPSSGLNFTFLPLGRKQGGVFFCLPPRWGGVFASFERITSGGPVSAPACGSAPIPLHQAPEAPKGLRPLCFHCPALPHHKSLPINAPVCAGGAGTILRKAWAGLCALQLGRWQQPSPPRLEIV